MVGNYEQLLTTVGLMSYGDPLLNMLFEHNEFENYFLTTAKCRHAH